MNNIFGLWDQQRMESTMTRLQREVVRLRRKSRMDRIVYWSLILGIGIVVGLQRWL